MPPDELVRLWTASDADARHFRDHIKYFDGHFSFTSLHCTLDSATTDTRNTFRAHGAIYHNLINFGKEESYEPNHLELYFYDDDPYLVLRLSKCREKTEQKDREVIRMLVNIFNTSVNPYSDHLRTMGEVEDFSDYHIEFNLDQQLDQRTYNKPLMSEVAAVWVEGSEHQGQFENSIVLHGKDRSWKGIRSYHGCYDPLSYPLFFQTGEFGWHNCIPKVGVTEAQINRARAIRKAHAQALVMMKVLPGINVFLCVITIATECRCDLGFSIQYYMASDYSSSLLSTPT
jgi:hypothetical protein